MLKAATILVSSDIFTILLFMFMKKVVKHMFLIHLQVAEAFCTTLPNFVHSSDSFFSLLHC